RVHDPDGDAQPIEARAVGWPEDVRVLHRGRVETAPTHRGALRLGRRCLACRDELEVTHRWVEGHNGGDGLGRPAHSDKHDRENHGRHDGCPTDDRARTRTCHVLTPSSYSLSVAGPDKKMVAGSPAFFCALVY